MRLKCSTECLSELEFQLPLFLIIALSDLRLETLSVLAKLINYYFFRLFFVLKKICLFMRGKLGDAKNREKWVMLVSLNLKAFIGLRR